MDWVVPRASDWLLKAPSEVARSTPMRTKPVIGRALVILLKTGFLNNFDRYLLEVWAEQRLAAGAELAVLVLFSLSTLFHNLGRGHTGPSRTIRSLCRTRTRLFVLSEFFGRNYNGLAMSKAVLNPVGARPVLEPIFTWTFVGRSIRAIRDPLLWPSWTQVFHPLPHFQRRVGKLGLADKL